MTEMKSPKMAPRRASESPARAGHLIQPGSPLVSQLTMEKGRRKRDRARKGDFSAAFEDFFLFAAFFLAGLSDAMLAGENLTFCGAESKASFIYNAVD
jgi:hypothetical protein